MAAVWSVGSLLVGLEKSLNARFSWEFRPLSFLYVVYNDRQAIQQGTAPTARSLIVKLTWLLQL